MPSPNAPLELLTVGAIAEILDVSRRRVYQIIEERNDFPRPFARTRGHKPIYLWLPEPVDDWARTADRSPGYHQPPSPP